MTYTSLLNISTETLHFRPTITVSDLAAAKKKQNKQNKTHSFVLFVSWRSTETSFWLIADSSSQIPSPPLFPPRLYWRLFALPFVLEMGILVSSAASPGDSEISSSTFQSSSGMPCTARTASRTCLAAKRNRFCDILHEKKQQEGSMMWEQRVYSTNFTAGSAICSVGGASDIRACLLTFLVCCFSPQFLLSCLDIFFYWLYITYIYTTSPIFVQNLIRFGWQFAGNWMGVQFKHAIYSGCPI